MSSIQTRLKALEKAHPAKDPRFCACITESIYYRTLPVGQEVCPNCQKPINPTVKLYIGINTQEV